MVLDSGHRLLMQFFTIATYVELYILFCLIRTFLNELDILTLEAV